VEGNGKCPFDPDDFMKLFSRRIAWAQAQGLSEIGVPDEEINRMLNEADQNIDEMVDNGRIFEVKERKITAERLVDAFDIQTLTPDGPGPR
jgi:hypothetical protein